jgi:choice-of-anchor A domain-containing protein
VLPLFCVRSVLTINAPGGVWIIINIDSTNPVFQNCEITLNGGITVQYVLYNFYESTSLTVQNVAVEGCVLCKCGCGCPCLLFTCETAGLGPL